MVLSLKAHRDRIGLRDGELHIDGARRAAADEATWTHVHPATGEDIGRIPIATADDVDAAVRAARRAFDEGPWPRSRAMEKIRVLRRIADLVRANADEPYDTVLGLLGDTLEDDGDRKSTRLNSSHPVLSRMPSSA